MRDALNSALDEELGRDPNVFILGEEVRVWICGCSGGPGCRRVVVHACGEPRPRTELN